MKHKKKITIGIIAVLSILLMAVLVNADPVQEALDAIASADQVEEQVKVINQYPGHNMLEITEVQIYARDSRNTFTIFPGQ